MKVQDINMCQLFLRILHRTIYEDFHRLFEIERKRKREYQNKY
jgi:hypothetical protein